MRRFLLICALLLTPFAATAQDDGQGRLVTLLENALSDDATRQVEIEGFRGALSSVATLDRMTIADEDGVWLVLEDVTLDWNRSALFTRALQVNELTASRLALSRLPAGGDDLPDAEATPFSLPELPLRVEIDRIAIDRVEIAEPVIGQAVVFSVAGEARLAGGEGAVDITLQRLDGPEGTFTLQAAYDNATENLTVDLEFIEAGGGLAASLLGIPGAPSIDLTIDGAGPLDAFEAEFALRTDDEPRLAGDLSILGTEGGGRRIALDVSGDVTAIVLPEYRPFFGPEVSIVAEVTQDAEGALVLDPFRIEAATVDLDGRVAIDAEGRPDSFALTGLIAPQPGGGDLVRLPTGAEVLVGSAEIDIGYDRSSGNAWRGDILIDRLVLDEGTVEAVALDLTGQITESETGIAGVTANVEIAAQGIALDDPALAEAVGAEALASGTVIYDADAPLRLTDLRIAAGGLEVAGQGDAAFGDSRLDLNFDLAVEADNLARFAAITGQESLSGAASLSLSGSAEPLSGAFDVTLDGQTVDLRVADAVPPELLAGTTEISGSVRRDSEGITLNGFAIDGREITLSTEGTLSSAASDLVLTARLRDAGLLDPALSGPISLQGSVGQTGDGPWIIDTDLTGPGDLAMNLQAEAGPDVAPGLAPGRDRMGLRFTADAAIGALAPYAAIVGQDLSGSASLSISGTAEAQSQFFDVAIDGAAQNLRLPDGPPPELFSGTTDISGTVGRDARGLTLDGFTLQGQELSLEAEGTLGPEDSDLVVSGQLRDAALFEPRLSGPVSLDASVTRSGEEPWIVDGALTGPGDLSLRLDAEVGPDVAPDIAPGEGRMGLRFDATAELGALAPYAAIAGQDLSGSASLSISGTAEAQSQHFDVTVEGQTRNLRVSDALPPQLLGGVTELSGRIERDEDGLTIDGFQLDGQELALQARGTLGRDASDLVVTGRLEDAGLLTPALSGPIRLGASVRQRPGQRSWTVDTTVGGPGGMVLTLDGLVGLPDGTVDLDLTGTVPLALADPFIAPRSIRGDARLDLSLTGEPALGNIGGQVTVAGARVAVPTLTLSLEDLTARATISGGTAQVTASTELSSGGQINVDGSIGFTAAALPARFDVAVTSATLVDPTLYNATIPEARLRYEGSLRGSARLSGEVLVGETEVRVPETSIGGTDAIPPITHVNETAAERRTRAFADLLEDEAAGGAGAGGAGGDLSLDITVRAPGRIFLRGRGLDAELGGTLRLTGTASDVVPAGRFDLIRGRLSILGQRLDLVEGSAALTGDFDPVIRLVAQTRSGEYIIRIILEGPVSNPTVTFTSQPDLPQDEVLAQLFFGRSVSNLSALQAIQLADAVAGLAGGGTGGGLLAGLRENLGLDDLDIQTGQDGGAAVRAGRYLSENVYTDLTFGSDGNTEVNLNIDLTPNITARGSFGSDGESSLGVFFERDY